MFPLSRGVSLHSQPAERGQGANNAIADADLFIRKMVDVRDADRKEVLKAIGEYDDDVFNRGSLEVEISHDMTVKTHMFDQYVETLLKYGTARSVDI